MKSYKIEKILLPVDFSETSSLAIEHASIIAKAFKAEIILLHVLEKHWEKFSIIVPEMRVSLPDDVITIIEKRLEETAQSIFLNHGVKTSCITSHGTIFSEIIAVSHEHQVDLIVMGTHGVSGFIDFFIGSNTFRVVTSSECPVLSIQTNYHQTGFKNILLPIDTSVHSRQKVHPAIILAKQFGATLHIAGLVDFTDATELHKFEIKLEQTIDYISKYEIACTQIILKGKNQAVMTLNHANECEADLILIMTDQEESIKGRLMGTYAQQIVNHSKVPVMSIQPYINMLDVLN